MKQTAVQLLKESIDYEMKLGTKMIANWDMYLEMEKQQIMDAFEEGMFHHLNGYTPPEYYEEIFNTEEK
jgi:L-ribulose-5-phosphate 3-epimerase UlaE